MSLVEHSGQLTPVGHGILQHGQRRSTLASERRGPGCQGVRTISEVVHDGASSTALGLRYAPRSLGALTTATAPADTAECVSEI